MIRELIGFIGMALIAVGVWMWSHPAGVVVAGMVIVAAAVLGFDGETKTTQGN